MSSPGSSALAKELHEAALHTQPAEARAVEQEGVEYQVEGNPLTRICKKRVKSGRRKGK